MVKKLGVNTSANQVAADYLNMCRLYHKTSNIGVAKNFDWGRGVCTKHESTETFT